MKKFVTITAVLLAIVYLVLHIVLASKPFQSKVLAEFQKSLRDLGLKIEIQSITFSAFRPIVYLNQVKISSEDQSKISLPEAITVEQIKLGFQPLSLLRKAVVIDELVLFYPRIHIKPVDELIKQIEKLAKKSSKKKQKDDLEVSVRRIGIVDADLALDYLKEQVSISTGSFSIEVSFDSSGQKNILVETPSLTVEKAGTQYTFTKLDWDVDLAPKSIRVNRGILMGDNMSVDLKGACSLPIAANSLPDTWNLSYDIKFPTDILNHVPKLKAKKLTGKVQSAGVLQGSQSDFLGNGRLQYFDVSYDNYLVGSGQTSYRFQEKQLLLENFKAKWSEGLIKSQLLTIDLNNRYHVSGDLSVDDLQLQSLLLSVREKDVPVKLLFSGPIKADGFLAGPMEITFDLNQKLNQFAVLDNAHQPIVPSNTILKFDSGSTEGQLKLYNDHFTFKGKMNALDGEALVEGHLNFGKDANFRVKGTNLSLTKLQRISDLEIGGIADLNAVIDVKGTDATVNGNFDVKDAEIQQLYFGRLKSMAQYQKDLLTFENAELKAIDVVRARGHVDFSKPSTEYHFDVQGRRIAIDQVFDLFRKDPLDFPQPSKGEANLKVTIDGGRQNDKAIEIRMEGQAKNFEFYEEKWQQGRFLITYRPDKLDFTRVTLLKKSSHLEFKGAVKNKSYDLLLATQGLKCQELNRMDKVPLTCDIQGKLHLVGESGQPTRLNAGDIKIVKSYFRGKALGDSTVTITGNSKQVEAKGELFEKTVRLKWNSNLDNSYDEIEAEMLYANILPFLSYWYGKDIQSVRDILVRGKIKVSGNPKKFSELSGDGKIVGLSVGLADSRLQNNDPFEIKFSKGLAKVSRFYLNGPEGQLSGEIQYTPDGPVLVKGDVRLDMQYLQPFIPGLAAARGKSALSFQIQGKRPKFDALGSGWIENGALRFQGMTDEIGNVDAQLSLDSNRINFDLFRGRINGGEVKVDGYLGIPRFESISPNLKMRATRIVLHPYKDLILRLSGDFSLTGDDFPFLLQGKCILHQGTLSSLAQSDAKNELVSASGKPPLKFDIKCNIPKQLLVNADMMNAEFAGDLNVVGTSDKIGLLGNLDLLKGTLFYGASQFNLSNVNVQFDSNEAIVPRFNLQAAVRKKDQQSVQQEYEINLQAIGTPQDYKLRLTSAPALNENEINALLLLGTTGRAQEVGGIGFATAIAGQNPIQSKLQNRLGLDVKVNTQSSTTATASGDATSKMIPTIQIQKEITKKTKLSYSNTLDLGGNLTSEESRREIKIEHQLDDNFTVNGSRLDRTRNSTTTPTTQSYGVDVRYRFSFE